MRGELLEKEPERLVVVAGGLGYEVLVNPQTAARLPGPGEEVELFISESTAMYGGGTTLYGFTSREDQQLFAAFREVKATGAKKALEYLDKASKSLPDFRRAILDQDARVLTSLFGFTRKTAERLLAELKGKLGAPVAGAARVQREGPAGEDGVLSRALDALAALGYTPVECRAALESARRDTGGEPPRLEELIRLALRRL